MSIEQKRKIFLDEIVDYYSVNPRCMKTGRYGSYAVFDGETAGVPVVGDVLGRFMESSMRKWIDSWEKTQPLYDIWKFLPEDILELGTEFLTECCCLHDNCSFWKRSELSEFGKEFYEEIVEKFCVK